MPYLSLVLPNHLMLFLQSTLSRALRCAFIFASCACTFPLSGQTLPSYVPSDGLVAFWQMNGDALDASTQGNHGVMAGPDAYVDRHGNSDGALFFNGAGDYISVPLSSSLAISGDFSSSVWVNLQGGSCNPRIYELHEVLNCGGYHLTTNGSNSGVRTLHGAGYGNCEQGMGFGHVVEISTHSWQLINITVDVEANQSTMKLYLNGTLVGTTVVDRNVGDIDYYGAPLCIGNIAPYRCDWYGGGMDELGFWNRALTAEEVLGLYLSSPVIPGCTNAEACNFNPEATFDDGNCSFPGCLDPVACNYDGSAACASTCDYDCNCIQSGWTLIGQPIPIRGIVKSPSGGFVLKTPNDVYHLDEINASWTSLGFDEQTSIWGELAELTGFNSHGELFVSTGWDCFYKRANNGNWINVGMCGFGTGGQWWTKGDNERILISKGGFLRNVYKSDDDGNSWEALGTGNEDWHHLVRATTGDFFAAAQSGVLRIRENGNIHSIVNENFPVMVEYSSCVAVTSQAVYASINGNELYKTLDSGDSWSFSGNSPNEWPIVLFRFFSESDALVQLNAGGISKFFHWNVNSNTWIDVSTGLPSISGYEWVIPYIFDNQILLATPAGLYFAASCSTAGCTDPAACNFSAEANSDDGSCVEAGCTDPAACNFDPQAGCDDGSCAPAEAVPGCMEAAACNYDAAAVCAGPCVYPPAGSADCGAGSAFCGEGMVWDAAQQTCLIDPAYVAGIAAGAAQGACGPWTVWDAGAGQCVGAATPACASDLSGNGSIGIEDLLILLSEFAMMCP